MNRKDTAWNKLVEASRGVRDDRDTTAPYGFATRVVAQAMSSDLRSAGRLFERWAWRALGVAGLFAALAVATDFSTAKPSLVDDLVSDETTVAALFD